MRNRYALYDRKRDEAGDSVEGDLQLASWCSHEGMLAEERAHLMAVVRGDPSHSEAWRLLGYHFREGVWANPAEQTIQRHEQATRDRGVPPLQTKLKQLVHELEIPEERVQAEASLKQINDPLAVPAIWKLWCRRPTRSTMRRPVYLPRSRGQRQRAGWRCWQCKTLMPGSRPGDRGSGQS